ncbi:putative armadillo repeat-containing protein 8 [Penaeus vannamei]|uniref:RNA-directed DNA polymerase n=1 Tax=Penaeus vannamei TaxID=6689 RepID=A0A3R7PEC6_PENVA|nr:putative armadillo repeat-containing protein 8 [Penaeus vannamei]
MQVSLNRLKYDAESMDQDSGINPEDVGSSSGDSRGALGMASSTPIDDGSEPDSLMADFEDRFDFAHGLNDFGYNTDEFEVFPVCSFENEELPSSAGAVGVPRVDLAHLSSVQREQLVQLIEYLEEGRLPPRRIPLPLDQFELRDRVLYHVKSDNERALLQLVIPRSLRGAALDAVHAVPSAGHQGVHRTYQRLRDHFYFPGMLAASRRYVASCTACQRRKGAIARTPLQSMPDVAEPFERVSVDILTLTPSAHGNKYVLVLIDHLTRFVELFPLASKDAQTVADVFLAEFVTRYGPRGPCYQITALNFAIVSFPTSVITSSVNDVPLYLLTGRDSHFPLVGSNHVIYAEGALPSLRSKLRAARVAAGEAARKARERWTADHDRRRRARPREYNEGDLVFVHRSVILHPSHGTRPLGPRWLGQVRVLKKLGPVAYVVRRPNSDGQEVTLHPNKFKVFRVTAEFVPPDDFPVWTAQPLRTRNRTWDLYKIPVLMTSWIRNPRPRHRRG